MISSPWLDINGFKARAVMPPSDVDDLVRLAWTKQSSDVNASDVTGESPLSGNIVAACSIVFVVLTPTAAIVADNTNYATISIYKRTNGGAPVLVGSISTTTAGSGSWSPNVPVAIPVVAGAVNAGDLLTAAITKSGTGVIVPALEVEALPSVTFLEQSIARRQSWIEDRLRKRYAIPFVAPYPEDALDWLAALVNLDMYRRRGFNPTSSQDDDAIIKAAADAKAEVLEAADGDTGKFDLPLRADLSSQSGIAKGGPFGYSEQSPYVSADRQACIGRMEDRNRTGSSS